MNPDIMNQLQQLVLKFFDKENVKIFIFGSRANNKESVQSDIDLGIIPRDNFNYDKLVLFKEALEDINIPYKVDVVDFNNVSNDFKKEAMKDIIVWKN